MSNYTNSVRKATDALEKAEQQLLTAKERLAAVRTHNGQGGYSVTVNGVVIAVSVCDRHTYQGTLLRGREMIHLGALKALGAEVSAAESNLKHCAAALLAAAAGGNND